MGPGTARSPRRAGGMANVPAAKSHRSFHPAKAAAMRAAMRGFAGTENRKTMRTHLDAKAMAKAMRHELAARGVEIAHSAALEIVARQFGLESWNVLASRIGGEAAPNEGITFEQAVPIVRIFDVAKAHEFYLGFLGFAVDWEHRFGDDFPLYMQVSRGGLSLHLSEHAGDASPGGNMVVYMSGIRAFHAELEARNYRYMKPGLETREWGLEVMVTDPFRNHIRFMERPAGEERA